MPQPACSHPADDGAFAKFLLFLNHLVPVSIENCSVLPGGKVESLLLALDKLLPALTGLIGSALGFYFGSKSSNA
jgi:hypothetical protein